MQINNNNLNATNAQLIAQLLQPHHAPLTISIVGAGGKTHLAYWLANFFKLRGQRVCVTTSTKMFLPDSACVDRMLALNNDYCKVEHSANDASIDTTKLCEQLFATTAARQAPSITFLYQKPLPSNAMGEPIKVKGLQQQALQSIHNAALFNVLIVEADGAKHQPIKAPADHEPCIPQCSQIIIGVTGAEAIFSAANSANIHRWPEFSSITHCLPQMSIGAAVLTRLLSSPQGMFKGAPNEAVKIWVINKCDLSSDPDALLQLAHRLLNDLPILKSVWLTALNTPTAIKNVLVN